MEEEYESTGKENSYLASSATRPPSVALLSQSFSRSVPKQTGITTVEILYLPALLKIPRTTLNYPLN